MIKHGKGYLLACMGTAVMLVIALANWPYDYYVILRFVILIVSGYGAILFYETNGKLAFVFAIIALFYNPFLPAHLSKEAWSVVNIITSAYLIGFVAWALYYKKELKPEIAKDID